MLYQAHPPIHTHEYFEFFCCVQGSGSQVLDQRALPMDAGALFCFPPGHPHMGNGDPNGGPCDGMVLFVSEHIFTPTVEGDRDALRVLRYLTRQAEAGHYLVPLSPKGQLKVTAALQSVERELRERVPGFQCAAKIHLEKMLLAILRDPAVLPALMAHLRPRPKRERLQDVRRYLHTHYMYPLTVEQVADVAHLSRSQFHQVFKEETGHTFTEYLNELRLQAAARLLRQTDTPIVHIAYRCGFRCLSHFYASFKEYFDVTPQAIRKQAVRASEG